MISFFLMVIGVGGVPEALKTWATWIPWLNNSTGRWISLLCGLSIFLAVQIYPRVTLLLRPELNLELGPSNGPSGDLVLTVINRGLGMKLFAKCRPLTMRYSPNPMTSRTYDLKWEGKSERQINIEHESSENLVIAAWRDSPEDRTLAEMWLTQYVDSELAKFNWCRWTYGDKPPEYDIEVTIFGVGARSPKTYQYTVRIIKRLGPLEMIPMPAILT
jgi:hypothetical protein